MGTSSSELPFVSVVIPTYNMKALLRDAVESVCRQSYPKDRYEIIVVDNSSTDGTETMMPALIKGSPCVISYYRKENEGPGASRNLGIAKAKGSIVAFTDSDCVADRDWLSSGMSAMGEGTGLVQGKTLPNPQQQQSTFSRSQTVINENGMYATCNIFYRREALDRAGGFSPDFCGLNRFGRPRWGGEDTDLAWRIKKLGWKSVFAEDAVIYHHVFPMRPWEVVTSLRKYQYQGLFHALPNLVKKHPELRGHLYHRYFLSRTKAFFDIFFLALLAGLAVHKIFFLFTLPYLALRSKDDLLWRPLREYHRGIAVIAVRAFRDLVDLTLLLGGSIWNRSIIL